MVKQDSAEGAEEAEQQAGLLGRNGPAQPRAWWGRRWVVLAGLVPTALLVLAFFHAAPLAGPVRVAVDGALAAFEERPGPLRFLGILKRVRKAVGQEKDDERATELAHCVTNLNLAAWKLVQLGAILVEAEENCPQGLYIPDKKIACMINLAAIVASSSAASSFFASAVFLCPGVENPDAECAMVITALFETFATFPASEGQIALFCPKTTPATDIQVFEADRRLGAGEAPAGGPPADALVPHGAGRQLATPLRAPENSLEMVFCAWQIGQIIWFVARAGVLIRQAMRICPPNEAKGKSVAACSEMIHEIITQFLNAAKFSAAAIANCVVETDVKAGCALGSLNFASAVTQAGSVASALANGACSNLDHNHEHRRLATVAADLRKLKEAKHAMLRRLGSQKKLTEEARQLAVAEEARDAELESAGGPLGPNATMTEVLRHAGVRLPNSTSWPPPACLADLRELQKLRPEVESADWDRIEETFHEWERKYHP